MVRSVLVLGTCPLRPQQVTESAKPLTTIFLLQKGSHKEPRLAPNSICNLERLILLPPPSCAGRMGATEPSSHACTFFLILFFLNTRCFPCRKAVAYSLGPIITQVQMSSSQSVGTRLVLTTGFLEHAVRLAVIITVLGSSLWYCTCPVGKLLNPSSRMKQRTFTFPE